MEEKSTQIQYPDQRPDKKTIPATSDAATVYVAEICNLQRAALQGFHAEAREPLIAMLPSEEFLCKVQRWSATGLGRLNTLSSAKQGKITLCLLITTTSSYKSPGAGDSRGQSAP
jgi:hypothetical protein